MHQPVTKTENNLELNGSRGLDQSECRDYYQSSYRLDTSERVRVDCILDIHSEEGYARQMGKCPTNGDLPDGRGSVRQMGICPTEGDLSDKWGSARRKGICPTKWDVAPQGRHVPHANQRRISKRSI
jgi:hypothetical protein